MSKHKSLSLKTRPNRFYVTFVILSHGKEIINNLFRVHRKTFGKNWKSEIISWIQNPENDPELLEREMEHDLVQSGRLVFRLRGLGATPNKRFVWTQTLLANLERTFCDIRGRKSPRGKSPDHDVEFR